MVVFLGFKGGEGVVVGHRRISWEMLYLGSNGVGMPEVHRKRGRRRRKFGDR